MKKLVPLVCVLFMVGLVQAATIRFMQNGSWETLATPNGTGGWVGPGWQSTVAPGETDVVRANWGGDVGNVVTLNYATKVNKFELGVGESGEFHIQSGGHLTALGDSRIGNNGATAARKGTLRIDAGGQVTVNNWLGIGHGTAGFAIVEGTLTTTSHLWMGTQNLVNSVGSLTINNGGVVNVGGNIGLGTLNGSSASGGSAVINVNSGGLLNLHHWSDSTSIMDGSVLNINGTGTVVIGGNRGAQADAYFALGKIASDLGAIQWVYTAATETAGDYTTITAIPEPATLVMLGLGALGLFRKKK